MNRPSKITAACSPSGRAAAADAVQPVSAVSSKASIPNAGFTPGPWVAVIHETIDEAREDSNFDWLRGDGDEARFLPLGCVWKDTGTGVTGLPGHVETIAANARLIAAAPELYEALAEYMACVAIASNPELANADVLTMIEARDRMEAARTGATNALAKARGEA